MGAARGSALPCPPKGLSSPLGIPAAIRKARFRRPARGSCRIGPFAGAGQVPHIHAPASGDSDADPFGNVYFLRRVSTHARLPLRILPRVLRRFTRPRSTARNPRKGASRLRRRLSLKALVVQPIRPRSAPCPRGRQRGVSRRAETKTTRKGTEDGEQA